MMQRYFGMFVVFCVLTCSLFHHFFGVMHVPNPVYLTMNNHGVYQSENDTGNPFENFTPEQFFNISSPLGILVYLSMFFCLAIPLSLLIIAIAMIAIFVRLGKIRKELSMINQVRQQTPSPPIQQQFVQQSPVQPFQQAPQQPPQSQQDQQLQKPSQGKQF